MFQWLWLAFIQSFHTDARSYLWKFPVGLQTFSWVSDTCTMNVTLLLCSRWSVQSSSCWILCPTWILVLHLTGVCAWLRGRHWLGWQFNLSACSAARCGVPESRHSWGSGEQERSCQNSVATQERRNSLFTFKFYVTSTSGWLVHRACPQD